MLSKRLSDLARVGLCFIVASMIVAPNYGASPFANVALANTDAGDTPNLELVAYDANTPASFSLDEAQSTSDTNSENSDEVKAAEDALNSAKSAQEAAQKAKEQADSEYSDAIKAHESAQTAVAQAAKNGDDKLQVEIENAQKAVTVAQGKLDEANANKETQERNLVFQQNLVKEAQEAYDKVVGENPGLIEASQKLQEAKDNLAAAQKAQGTANYDKVAADKAYADATEKVNELNSKVESAREKLKDAEAAASSASSAYNTAVAALNTEKGGADVDVSTFEDAVEEAHLALVAANNAVTNAKAQLESLRGQLTTAEATLAAANKALEEASAGDEESPELTAAKKKVKEAQEAYDKIVEDLRLENGKTQGLQEALNTANSNLTNAQIALKEAKDAVDTAADELQTAKDNLRTAINNAAGQTDDSTIDQGEGTSQGEGNNENDSIPASNLELESQQGDEITTTDDDLPTDPDDPDGNYSDEIKDFIRAYNDKLGAKSTADQELADAVSEYTDGQYRSYDEYMAMLEAKQSQAQGAVDANTREITRLEGEESTASSALETAKSERDALLPPDSDNTELAEAVQAAQQKVDDLKKEIGEISVASLEAEASTKKTTYDNAVAKRDTVVALQKTADEKKSVLELANEKAEEANNELTTYQNLWTDEDKKLKPLYDAKEEAWSIYNSKEALTKEAEEKIAPLQDAYDALVNGSADEAAIRKAAEELETQKGRESSITNSIASYEKEAEAAQSELDAANTHAITLGNLSYEALKAAAGKNGTEETKGQYYRIFGAEHELFNLIATHEDAEATMATAKDDMDKAKIAASDAKTTLEAANDEVDRAYDAYNEALKNAGLPTVTKPENPNDKPGTNPGTDPGTNPGNNPGSNSGTTPNPGNTNQGSSNNKPSDTNPGKPSGSGNGVLDVVIPNNNNGGVTNNTTAQGKPAGAGSNATAGKAATAQDNAAAGNNADNANAEAADATETNAATTVAYATAAAKKSGNGFAIDPLILIVGGAIVVAGAAAAIALGVRRSKANADK